MIQTICQVSEESDENCGLDYVKEEQINKNNKKKKISSLDIFIFHRVNPYNGTNKFQKNRF